MIAHQRARADSTSLKTIARAVAGDQAPPTLVGLGSQLGYALIVFRLQCGGQHASGALADDLVDQGARLSGTVDGDYAEHGAPS